MKKLMLIAMALFNISLFAADQGMAEGNGNCPDVVDSGRTISCPSTAKVEGNKCIDVSSGKEVDKDGKVITK